MTKAATDSPAEKTLGHLRKAMGPKLLGSLLDLIAPRILTGLLIRFVSAM